MVGRVLDFSAAFPPAREVKKAGYSGICAYISPGRESWMKGKNIGKAQHDAYVAAGLKIGFVWQHGGAAAPDVMRGRAGGIADAKAAKKKLTELGRPHARVFFAVDFDISLSQWNHQGIEYFDGVATVLSKEQIGIYGNSRVIAWAVEDDKIARRGSEKYHAWQTPAWSGGVRAKEAILYQGTANVPGPGGVSVDKNDVLFAGWADDVKTSKLATTPAKPVSKPKEVKMKYDVDMSSRFSFGGPRATSGIKRVVIHTTENSPRTPPENVANYQISSQTGSYHVLVGSNGRTVLCNTDNWTTWSTGNTQGNVQGVNLSFTVYSAQSQSEWLKQDAMLEAGAKQVAEWCKKYSIPVKKSNGDPGVCGHGDMRRFGGTDHTDPGSNFPWDVFIKKVQKYYNGGGSTSEDTEMAVKDYFEKTRYSSAVDGSKVKNSLSTMIRLVDAYTWELVKKKYPSKVKGSQYSNTIPEYITDISANVMSLHKKIDELTARIDAAEGTTGVKKD